MKDIEHLKVPTPTNDEIAEGLRKLRDEMKSWKETDEWEESGNDMQKGYAIATNMMLSRIEYVLGEVYEFDTEEFRKHLLND